MGDQTLEVTDRLDQPWSMAPSDAYYDVATRRTTLRGRRDLVIGDGDARVSSAFARERPARAPGRGCVPT